MGSGPTEARNNMDIMTRHRPTPCTIYMGSGPTEAHDNMDITTHCQPVTDFTQFLAIFSYFLRIIPPLLVYKVIHKPC